MPRDRERRETISTEMDPSALSHLSGDDQDEVLAHVVACMEAEAAIARRQTLEEVRDAECFGCARKLPFLTGALSNAHDDGIGFFDCGATVPRRLLEEMKP